MRYSRGDVVVLELPFSNGLSYKKRPALVVANRSYLSETSDLVVCAITSNLGARRFPGSTEIVFWKEAGLHKPSIVKASIHTVDRASVYRRLGRLRDEDLDKVDGALRSVLF